MARDYGFKLQQEIHILGVVPGDFKVGAGGSRNGGEALPEPDRDEMVLVSASPFKYVHTKFPRNPTVVGTARSDRK